LNPHLSQPVQWRGCAPESARITVIMVHGRGRDTDDILGIVDRLELPDVAFLAATAFENSWYPNRFMDPLESNQPRLDQALERVDSLAARLMGNGVVCKSIVLLGFSQGACLVSEYAVRHARRYGGIIALTGGLIGPAGSQWDFPGSFHGTPVFLGTSDADEWVPVARVQETGHVMAGMGADVELKIYPGLEHIVNDDEVAQARKLIRRTMDATGNIRRN